MIASVASLGLSLDRIWGFTSELGIKSTVVLALVLGLHWALHRRHVLACGTAWNACLIGLALLPVAILVFPQFSLDFVPASVYPRGAEMGTTQHSLAESAPFDSRAGADSPSNEYKNHSSSPSASSSGLIPVSTEAVALNTDASGGRPYQWRTWVVTTIGVGMLFVGARLLFSLAAVGRLRRSAIPLQNRSWLRRLEHWTRRVGIRRSIRLAHSSRVNVPIVVGAVRPTIVVPTSMTENCDRQQMDVVLAHELAHVARGDFVSQLMLRFLQVFYWYNPLIWLGEGRIAAARERACDEFCVHAIGSSESYGNALLEMADALVRRPTLCVGLAVVQSSNLACRLEAIGQSRGNCRCVSPWWWRTAWLVGGLTVVGLLGGAGTRDSEVRAAVPTAEEPKKTLATTDNRIEQMTAEAVVSGQVVDLAGRAVANAEVAVVGRPRDPSMYSLLTDELRLLGLTKADGKGRFRLSIPKLSSAAYFNITKVVAVADGFNLGLQPIGEDVENPSVTVSLTAEQSIHGRVIDVNGKSAAGVKVHVTGIGESRPGGSGVIQCRMPPSQLPFWPQPVTTDRDGRFVLCGVDRNGILSVQVRDDRFAIDRIHIGLAGEKDAHVTTSPSGEVILSPPPARIFEGKVTYDDTHRPVAKARVEIGASFDPTPSDSIILMAGLTDANGRFRLNPYSGKMFRISVDPPDGEPYLNYQKEINLSDGQQPPQIEIALPRGVVLRGKITETPSGEPVAGAALKYEEQSRPPYRPDRVLPDHSPPSVVGVSRADGSYQIAIPPGQGTLFVQGPGGDYIRQTISTWDFKKKARWAVRHYVGAYALLDVKPSQESTELNLTIRRGVTVRGRIVGPEDRPSGDVLILSRHFLGVNEDTWRGGNTRVKDGQFELHGLDPDASVPFYFLDPKNESGATVEISGKSAENGPLVVHLQPCGKAVVRFVTPQGKPKTKYNPNLMILVSPGPFRADEERSRKEISSDQDFVANFDREHYWNMPATNDEGRGTFPALIPGATYRIGWMNRVGDWGERDFSLKSGETLVLPDIVIPEPAP